jgi:oligopeptide/dipeptide ABC transporter ATP-binding protein
MTAPLLTVEDLRVRFATEDGVVRAVDGVSFEVHPGEVLAIVGESGSGKSVTAQTIMGLTRSPNASFDGRISFDGQDLLAAPDDVLRGIRGNDIAMVFQDPMTSLNPVYRIGWQIVEQIRAHQDLSAAQARERAVELLREVGIPNPGERADNYPHEFSGGMRQRAMMAMALSCAPRLVIADEPTTALDVTIQAQILELMRRLRDRLGSVILITHDLGVVVEIADRVLVMYGGMVVEQGTLEQIFYDPQHPYTWGLMGSLARVDEERSRRLPSIPGLPPSLIDRPQGCAFRPRCPHAHDRCLALPPLEVRDGAGHPDRCWLAAEDKRSRRVVEDRIGLAADVT